jgi:5-(carboxyamino)imidazole ribonucleotide mutase
VIGVPVKSSNSIDGWDSILSIQMPGGVPVATVALNGAKTPDLSSSNLGSHDKSVLNKVIQYKLG